MSASRLVAVVVTGTRTPTYVSGSPGLYAIGLPAAMARLYAESLEDQRLRAGIACLEMVEMAAHEDDLIGLGCVDRRQRSHHRDAGILRLCEDSRQVADVQWRGSPGSQC